MAFLTITLKSAAELRERIYLHTDKQTYLAGELLWMKLYLTDKEGKPVSFSKVGYVELLDHETAQVQVKLDLEHATGEGWMELPVTLPTGYYRLIAYTRNMKNENEDIFFHKTIGIVNTFRIDETILVDTITYLPVQSVLDNNLSVATEKNSYSKRWQSKIQIQGLPEDIHSLSVSIAGKDLVFTDRDINITKWYKELVNLPHSSYQSLYTPEYEGHIIRGIVRNVKTDAVIDNSDPIYPLVGFVGDQIRLFGGQRQILNNGQVEFYTKGIKGTHELVTSTTTLSENIYRIDIESPFASHKVSELPIFKINPSWEENLTQRTVGLQVLHAFNADSLSRIDTTYAHFQWKPDRSYILDEYTRFTRMDEVVIEFIPSVRFRRINGKRILSVLDEETSTFSIGNTLVLLDGIPITDHELIYNYDPLLIYKIDVYKSKFSFGGQFFNGIISIVTYNKDYPTLTVDNNTQIYDYEGTQAHRYFYAPSYEKEENRTSRIPDFRHTLLWVPDVQIEGKSSVSIPFTTSELTGEFQVTVEGLTKDGQPVRGVTTFKVE